MDLKCKSSAHKQTQAKAPCASYLPVHQPGGLLGENGLVLHPVPCIIVLRPWLQLQKSPPPLWVLTRQLEFPAAPTPGVNHNQQDTGRRDLVQTEPQLGSSRLTAVSFPSTQSFSAPFEILVWCGVKKGLLRFTPEAAAFQRWGMRSWPCSSYHASVHKERLSNAWRREQRSPTLRVSSVGSRPLEDASSSFWLVLLDNRKMPEQFLCAKSSAELLALFLLALPGLIP